MSGVYIDTGLFVALAFKDDEHHERARELFYAMIRGDYGRPIITSLPVIVETAMFIHRNSRGRNKRAKACKKLSLIFDIIEKYKIDIIYSTSYDKFGELIRKAKELYFERNGQLDFVDAINVILMQQHNCSKIVSFDNDYDQFTNIGITRIY